VGKGGDGPVGDEGQAHEREHRVDRRERDVHRHLPLNRWLNRLTDKRPGDAASSIAPRHTAAPRPAAR
jgi:hypothetical protein